MGSDPTVQTILDTSLSDNCKDATVHDVIIGSDDNEQQAARHSPLSADDQRELPDKACPPLFGRDDRYHDDRAVPLPVQPETAKRERRYSYDGYDVGIHHNVVVYSTHPSLTLTKNAVSLKHVFQRIVSVLASDRKKKESHSKPIISL